MTFDIRSFFNRSFKNSFAKREILFLALILAFCGVFILFCRAIGFIAGAWGLWSLTLFSLLLSAIPLQGAGIILLHSYVYKLKKESSSIKEMIAESWETLMSSAVVILPLLLAGFLMTILMGIFLLLRQIPFLGSFFSIVFSFGPYFLIVGSFMLVVATLFLLFFISPSIALGKSTSLREIFSTTFKKVGSDFYTHFCLFFAALLPALMTGFLLWLAFYLTEKIYPVRAYPFESFLQSLFLVLPALFLWTPAVLFFFNFSAEAFLHFHPLSSKEGIKSHLEK